MFTSVTHSKNTETGEHRVRIETSETEPIELSKDTYESLISVLDLRQRQAEEFVEKHDATVDQQFRCLIEEVGELSESLNEERSRRRVLEELGDIVFIAYTIAELHDGNLNWVLRNTFEKNLDKNTEKQGNKVTKE